jgi:hypothetical protein
MPSRVSILIDTWSKTQYGLPHDAASDGLSRSFYGGGYSCANYRCEIHFQRNIKIEYEWHDRWKKR